MNIESHCSCGARLTLTPAGYQECGYGNYTSARDSVAREEREAVAKAFTEWVSAHRECCRLPQPQFVSENVKAQPVEYEFSGSNK